MPCPCSHVDGSMWIYFDVIFDVRRTFLRALFAVVVDDEDPGEYYYIIL